ncbi:uncharacterized protein FIBRA_03756 [Fibroporia radiculosa]|uniref:Uncharacterized protein n=1 Tax=Fibroporia radiculosa TaxID=599839 RepID=J4HW59_9APHY|nr:uncharacterized protein FIBRA_03756 [Fibroporia radiculosa]CCM01692.1 predicted protein [Fibroporia radiculosa]
MTTLPSFVELMASLGLDNSARPATLDTHVGPACFGSHFHHSRTSSTSSSCSSFSSAPSGTVSPPHPSITVDEPQSYSVSRRESSPSGRDWESERRPVRVARYSPYVPTISHTRKKSAPTILEEEPAERMRALSTSPYLSPATCNMNRRSSSGTLQSARRPHKLALSERDLAVNTPISTFVRRKTPQASPSSPTFPHRRRSRASSLAQPVSIPTLPFVFPAPTTYRYPSSDLSEDEDMHDVCDSSSETADRPCRLDVSASSRLARASDPGIRASVFSLSDGLASNPASTPLLPVA